MREITIRPLGRTAGIALGVSLVLTSVLGSTLIIWYWAGRQELTTGVVRAVAFVALMVGVHWLGSRLYRRQGAVSSEPATKDVLPLDDELRDEAERAAPRPSYAMILLQQGIALAIASVMLDGGMLFRVFIASIAVFWACAGLFRCMRSGPMTRTDVQLMNYGFWLIASLMFVLAGLVWTARGIV